MVRVPRLDAIRFFAVCAVVVQHGVFLSAQAGVPGSLVMLGLSIWAVPTLFATSGYLSTLGEHHSDLRKRARRLLFPYAVWSVLLYLYSAQGAIRAGTSLAGADWTGIVFAGQAFYTLWFLAMLMYATLAGSALRTRRSRLIGACIMFVSYAAVSAIRFTQPVLDTDTWGGFLIIAPLCVATYLGASVVSAARPPRRRLPLVVVAVAAVIADALMYAAWGTTLTQGQQSAILTVGTIPGFLALWAARRAIPSAAGASPIRMPPWLPSWLPRAGRYSLGIYVIHAPLLNVLRYVTGNRDSDTLALALVFVLASIGLSLLASYIIARSRRLAPLVM